jgi:long-chain acyl-CoA synthetase
MPGATRFGTVGRAVPGVEVRIAGDGEILVRGPNVFLGYYKDAAATSETLVDGWLHSGDLGSFDSAGFLSITGRKKEIIITSGGKNITPKNIEEAIKLHPAIGEAVVIGDRRKYLVALLTLDPDLAPRWASEHGVDVSNLHESPALRADLQRHLDGVNAEVSRVEGVKRFAVLPRPFSLEAGELTPTLKIKRRIVEKNWSAVIESLYGSDGE